MVGTELANLAGLRLVDGPAATPIELPVKRSNLSASPFRPGELPETIRIMLSPETCSVIAARSSDEGLPCELWLRLTIESRRVASEIAQTVGCRSASVVEILDGAASSGEVRHSGDEPEPLRQ